MSTPSQYMTQFVTPAVNDANAGLSIYQGATSGTTAGQTRAGLTAAKQAGKLTGSGALNTGATGALDALNIYQGINQGGVQGYGRAAGSGLQLAGLLASNPELTAAGGYVLAPLAVYNAVNNWQSGKTGSNAINGAEAGAAVGSIIPGIGTLIGGVVGGAVGALSSAFGPGAKDPETAGVQGLIDYTSGHGDSSVPAQNASNPYLELAGLMDRRESTLPMYQQYGRMGEQKFTNDMTSQINDAIKAGTISADSSGTDVYNKVVAPWVQKMGSGYDNVGSTYSNVTQGLLQDMTNQYMSGQAASDWKAVGGDSPFANIYSGSPITAAQAAPQIAATPGQGARNMSKMAGGGTVNRQDHLMTIFKGSYAGRKPHFDDGGYVDYYTPTGDGTNYEYQPPDLSSSDIDQSQLNMELNQANQSGLDSINNPYGNNTAGGDSSSALSGLGNLLKGLGVSGSSAAPYAALLPLLQSILGGNKGATAPGVPSQYSGQLMNMQTPPAFNRQQNPVNMTQQQWLHSAEGPETNFYRGNQLPITSMSAPNAAQMTSSPYTGSQVNPYSVVQPTSGSLGNQILQQAGQMAGGQQPPTGMMTSQPVVGIGGSGVRPVMMAAGGLAGFEAGGRAGPIAGPYSTDLPATDQYQPPYRPNPPTPRTPNRGVQHFYANGGPTTFDSTGSGLNGLGHVKGPGDGTSDSIQLRNAYLSNGEYVIDAPTVSALGNGSNDAGAKKLDQFRRGVRAKYGQHMARGKQPMNVNAYMGGRQ